MELNSTNNLRDLAQLMGITNLSRYQTGTNDNDNDNDNDGSYDYNSKSYINDTIRLQKFREELASEDTMKREVAEKIANTPPFKRPQKDNSKTVQKFKQDLEELKEKIEKNKFVLQTNYITTEQHSCLIGLDKLKKIALKDMMVNKIHHGNFFECKTIANPFYVSGMNLLVEDDNGDIEMLILYNYESKYYDVDPSLLIPIGTKLIIKEPHLQMIGLNDDDFGIRIDSPTDVIVKAYPEHENKSIEELVQEGDKSLEKSHFHLALRFYSQAIDKSNKKNLKAFINRSKSYIRLEKYYSAYQDAQQAVQLDPKSDEAYFQMGISAYLRRTYEIALEAFETCLKLDPTHTGAIVEIKKTRERINESKNGVYDFEALYEQYFRKENLFMDVADYMSDKIKITDIENKSKGVVADDFIQKGTLLVVSKAASAVFHNKVDFRKKSYNMINCHKETFYPKNESENFAKLALKIQDDPEIAQQIYSLYGGPDYNREPLDHPLVDIQRVEAIYSFNSFEIKNSLDALEITELQKEIEKFQSICEEDYSDIDLASVSLESKFFNNFSNLKIKTENLDNQTGLWSLAAYFNHACVSNCVHRTLGDIQVFYTKRDIQKGEELTIRYFPSEWTYTEKVKRGNEIYGFVCNCDLCKQDEQDPMRLVREHLLTQITYKNENRIVGVGEALTDVQKVRYTYSNRPGLQLQLVNPLQFLAFRYRETYKYVQSARCFEEIFELIRDFNDFGAITVLKEAHNDYESAELMEQSEACKQKAFDFFHSIHLNKLYAQRLWEKMCESNGSE